MARACVSRAGSLEPYINTVDTARDMDRIRQAIGVPTISFYGMSYGTVLGAVYADLFPHHVDTMVLDGAVDINAPLTQQAEEEAPAAEQSLDHLFATCQQQTSCPLGADPSTYFRSLVESLTRHPLPAPGSGDSYPVTVGDLDGATLFALSVPGSTGSYYNALVAADHGNGMPLRTLSLGFAEDIDGAPLVDPQWTITCNDAASHPGPLRGGNAGPHPQRPVSTHRRLLGHLHHGRLCLLADRPPTGRRPPPQGITPCSGDRQHRGSQYPDHRGQAPGRRLPLFPHVDLEGMGAYLVAQRADRCVHATAGERLPVRRPSASPEHGLQLSEHGLDRRHRASPPSVSCSEKLVNLSMCRR